MNEFEARLLVGTTNAFALFLRALATVFGAMSLVLIAVAWLGRIHIKADGGAAVLLLIGCVVAGMILGRLERGRRFRIMAALTVPPRPPS